MAKTKPKKFKKQEPLSEPMPQGPGIYAVQVLTGMETRAANALSKTAIPGAKEAFLGLRYIYSIDGSAAIEPVLKSYVFVDVEAMDGETWHNIKNALQRYFVQGINILEYPIAPDEIIRMKALSEPCVDLPVETEEIAEIVHQVAATESAEINTEKTCDIYSILKSIGTSTVQTIKHKSRTFLRIPLHVFRLAASHVSLKPVINGIGRMELAVVLRL